MVKLVGEETKKALNNFVLTSSFVRLDLICSIIEIKLAAAKANGQSGKISEIKADAIVTACQYLLENLSKYRDEFVLPSIQGGAGTSINMNVNEVVAALVMELAGTKVHYLDDVNASQSTNDVLPSALKLACLKKLPTLITNLEKLVQAFQAQAAKNANVKKLARTHLQDAVITDWGEVFSSYSQVVKRNLDKIKLLEPSLLEINLGGTAIGNGVNSSKEYRRLVYQELQALTKFQVKPALNLMSLTSSSTDFLTASQTLTTLFVDLSKIATDMRILSSGPNGGIGELRLMKLQKGSTIMPGKVNPILPETVNQIYFRISGHNLSIEQACHASNLELSNMFPVIAENLLDSLTLSIDGVKLLAKCVQTLEVNADRCAENLKHSTAQKLSSIGEKSYDQLATEIDNGR